MIKNTLLYKWVNEPYLIPAHQQVLQKRFSKEKPFSHIVLRDIFVPERFFALKLAVQKESFAHIDSDLFSFSQTKNLLLSKNMILREFIALLMSVEFCRLISNITRNDILLKKVDCSAFLYSKKDYLLCHDDRIDNRAIAYILYLNDDFNHSDGGALCLHSINFKKRPDVVKKIIIPLQNSLVLFAVSPISFHSVQEVINPKNRLTVGGWFYRK